MLISSKKLNQRQSGLAVAWLMKGDTQLENMINPKQCAFPTSHRIYTCNHGPDSHGSHLETQTYLEAAIIVPTIMQCCVLSELSQCEAELKRILVVFWDLREKGLLQSNMLGSLVSSRFQEKAKFWLLIHNPLAVMWPHLSFSLLVYKEKLSDI